MSAGVCAARSAVCLALVVALAGCGIFSRRTAPERQVAPPSAGGATPAATGGKKAGAYYQDDGPGDNPPANLDAVADAVPRSEPLRAAANKPYVVFGREYVPQTALKPFRQRGVASWYGRKFNGAQTSSGEIYDMYAMTAAHPTLPIPSYARVTNLANSRTVVVRVNDRGPFLSERIMDLSYAAAYRLGYVQAGSAQVEVESIDPASYIPATAIVKNGVAPVAPSVAVTGAVVADAVIVKPLPDPPAAEPRASPPAAPVELPLAAEASGIYVQLGAFSQRSNAESLRTRVTQRLEWLKDSLHVNIGDGLYRLQLGPYRDRAEAERMAQRIQDALELKPSFIIK